MTPNEIIKELTNIAVIMTQLGDLHKAMVIREALKLLEKSYTPGAVDEFDVALAESMFTKRSLHNCMLRLLMRGMVRRVYERDFV